jgi:hypothetical protein
VSQTKAQLLEGKAANIEFSVGSAASPTIFFTGDTNTGIYSPTADTVGVSTGGVQRTTVDSSGRLLVGVGSANANGGVLQLSGGITFPGTQVGASDINTLDDYEEGTWTPSDGSGAGRTFTNLVSSYVKIGRIVTLFGYFTVDASVSGAAFRVNGLPFASATTVQLIGTFGSSSGNAGVSILGASASSIFVGTPATYNTNLTNAQVSFAGVAFTMIYSV